MKFLLKKSIVFLPILLSFFLFGQSLNYFFFQDDFYELLISEADNIQEFIALFSFLENRSSYRPIGLQLFFFSMNTLFGVNALFYRLLVFTLFFASYFLLRKIVIIITKNDKVGFLAAALWITSSIHFMTLSWLAASWLIIGTFLSLLTLIFFLKFENDKNNVYYLLTIAFFILALGAFEFFISLPIIMGSFLILLKKYDFSKTLKIIMPFLLTAAIYVLLRREFATLPNIEEYQPKINTESLKALFWYSSWSLNVPEEFKKQIIGSLIVLNSEFTANFKNLIIRTLSGVFLVLIVYFLIPLYGAFKKRNFESNIAFFCFIWFLASIAPVLVIPNHAFSMYLAFPSIGLYLLMAYLAVKNLNSKLIYPTFFLWFALAYSTVSFYKETSWVVYSERFAREFAQEMKSKFENLEQGTVILYQLSDHRKIQAFSNENEIKIIYNDPSLRIFYDEKKLNEEIKAGLVSKDNIIRAK